MPDSDYKDTFNQEEATHPDTQEVETVPLPKEVTRDGNDLFPISCKRFVATLLHTEHAVYSRLLLIEHARENHTIPEWHSIIGDHAAKPAHPSAL